MATNNRKNNDKRGLASADDKTKERVAKAGGKAFHAQRGDHGSDSNSKDKDNK